MSDPKQAIPLKGPLPFSVSAVRKIQSITGLVFGGYMSMHFVQLASANYGPNTYNGLLKMFRAVYQNPLVEAVVLGCIALHALAGITTRARRNAAGIPTSSLPDTQQAQINTGVILMILVPVHFVGTRLKSLVHGSEYLADFSLITWTLETVPYFYYPYYITFAGAGMNHFLTGMIKGLASLNVIDPVKTSKFFKSTAFLVLGGIGGVVAVASVIAFRQGLYFDVPRTRYPEFELTKQWMSSLVNPVTWFGKSN